MKKSNLFKRILAYTLVLSVIFSQIVFSSSFSAAEKISVWDGTKAESFAGGDGSAASPFLIETAEQLYKMLVEHHTYDTSYGKYFEITKDIYLNNVVDGDSIVDLWGKKNWLAGYGDTIATSSKANSFNGTLNGNGHTIYGLYADGSEKNGSSLGLFPAISDSADIKNLNFNNVLITGGSGNAGAIAGSAYWKTDGKTAKITNCSVTNATIGQWENIKYVGGFVGATNDCTITFTNCYAYDLSLSNFKGSIPGGMFGTAWGSGKLYLTNCYTVGYFPAPSLVSKAICTNVYTDIAIPEGNTTANVIVLTADQMKGDAAKTNMSGFDFAYEWKTVADGYPIQNVKLSDFWDGTKATTYAGGSGTASDPYLIENGAQFYKMVAENSNTSSTDTELASPKYFKVINDIYLNKVTDADLTAPTVTDWDAKGFYPWYKHYYKSQGFCGVVDGGGHTVYGLYCNGAEYSGLINSITDYGKVYDLNLRNAFIYGKSGVGGIVGLATGSLTDLYVSGCTVDNVYLDGGAMVRLGGIVGGGDNSVKHVSISDCSVTRAAFKTTHATYPNIQSGIFGYTGEKAKGHTVSNCYTDDSVHPVTDTTTTSHFTKFTNYITYTNVYTLATNTNTAAGVTTLTAEQMKGEAAKTNMPGFDFDLVWHTVDGGYPILRENPLFAWDGTATENFAGGTGTAADPFLIENGGQLYKMVAEYSNTPVATKPETQTYFKITEDINLGGKQWYCTGVTGYPNSSNYTTGFSGIIYGEGHTIYGLYSNKASAMVGLIPAATQGAEIHDLHLEIGNLPKTAWNTYAVGGLIGLAVGASGSAPIVIDGCSVKNFTIESRDASAAFVGILYSQSVAINNCYSVGNNLSHTSTAAGVNSGAFIGVTSGNDWDNSIVITNSYTDGTSPLMYATDAFKAITTYTNVYTSNEAYDGSVAGLTKLTAAQMTGIAARDNLAGFNFNQIWQYGAEGEYPTHKTNEEKAMYWNGTAADGFAGGEGTIEKPYEISNAEQLYLLANSDTASTAGKYYKLTSDIEISSVHEGWKNENPYSWTKKTAYLDGFTYSNSFAGTLDGAGYTVSGLYYEDVISDNGTYAYGLIPFVTADAVIKNINVENVAGNVTGNAYMGAVAGAVHVTAEDVANPLKMVQFVGVNVANSGEIALLGGATRGVKFELCNAEKLIGSESEKISVRNCNTDSKYSDSVLIYNSLNADSTALTNVRKYFLGSLSNYITDINGDSEFDIRDLVSAKKSLAMESSDEYALVWSQEFNNNSLDYSVWSTNTTMSKGTTLEYADNTTVNNGSLTLSCNDTGKTNDNGDKIYSVNYGLSTIDTMSFKYGILEMRAKVPFGAGAFPSLWLTSRSAIGYEALSEYSTEIDIFEVFGKTNSNNALVTCIHKWYNDENGNKTGSECSSGTGIQNGNSDKVSESDRSYIINGDAQNDFHTFVFEWDEDLMSFSVDGTVYYTALRSEMDDFDLNGYNTNSDGIFNQAVCLRINNQMYTTGEGAAYTYNGNADEIDASKLNYEIDYIRLYQKNDGKSEITFK